MLGVGCILCSVQVFVVLVYRFIVDCSTVGVFDVQNHERFSLSLSRLLDPKQMSCFWMNTFEFTP